MAAKKSAKKAPSNRKGNAAAGGSSDGWTEAERAAMKERAREMKRASRSRGGGESEEGEVLAKIAAMSGSDRVLGERLHAIIRSAAPELAPRLWYGMPAYARNGKVVCFFQDAAKFKARYATLGFSDQATLDDGAMWPTSFALKELTAADAARIVELVKRAVS